MNSKSICLFVTGSETVQYRAEGCINFLNSLEGRVFRTAFQITNHKLCAFVPSGNSQVSLHIHRITSVIKATANSELTVLMEVWPFCPLHLPAQSRTSGKCLA